MAKLGTANPPREFTSSSFVQFLAGDPARIPHFEFLEGTKGRGSHGLRDRVTVRDHDHQQDRRHGSGRAATRGGDQTAGLGYRRRVVRRARADRRER